MEPRCYQCNTLLADINAACPSCLPNWNRTYASEVPQPDAPVSWEEQRYLDAQATIAALQKEIATRDSTDSILATRIRELEARLTQRTAELERVRGELAETAHNVNVYQSLYSTGCMDRALLENELRDIRTLIAALPKVEGEVTCSQQFDSAWRLHYWQVEAYEVAGECVYRLNNLREDDAKAYAALLKHRQGMEG